MMLLKSSVLGVVLAVTFGQVQAANTNLTMSTYVPPSLGLYSDFMVPWAKQIEMKNQGLVHIDIQSGGSALGNITKQWDQVVDGIVDISFGLQGIPRGRFPCSQVIELPFLTQSVEQANQVLWSLYKDQLQTEYSDVKVLALMAHPPGVLATTGNKRVEKPEDLRGLRIRVPSPYVAAMIKNLGGIPVGMPPSQVYQSMQTGSLDGVVLPWAGLKEFHITEVATNAIEIGAYTTPFFFVMNKDKYNELPAHIKQVIDEASGDGLVAKFPSWWKKWGEQGAAQITGAGGEVITPNTQLRKAWVEATAPTVEKLVSKLQQQCPIANTLIHEARVLIEN